MDLPKLARDWFDRGAIENLGGVDCFVVDGGGGPAARALVWLHGFPSSSLDWRAVVDRVGTEERHLLMDFPGFGFSAKPVDYSYSLVDQADRVLLMLAARGIERIRLVTHDMGTSVACELLARQHMGLLPVTIDGVVFMNGSVFIEQARLTPSQRLLRSPLGPAFAKFSSERLFRWQISKAVGVEIADDELRAMWALMRRADGLARLPQIIDYIGQRYRYYPRWTGVLPKLDMPVRVIWGQLDPVAVPAIGKRLADTIPGAKLESLDDIGHFPMLEAPQRLADSIDAFLQRRSD